MAGLIQEIEDPLPHFPPAPPPSPEAQPRACNIFEIPASAFNPLDMRQNDFADLDLILSQTQSSSRNPFLETVHERENPFADEDDFGFPASPKKRICNSPSSFPEGYNIKQSNEGGGKFTSTSLPYSQTTRQHHSPVHFYSPPLLTVPKSNSPPTSQSFHQTSPHLIPSQKPENGFENAGNYRPTHNYHSNLSSPSQFSMLSKSFDLHNVHPCEMASELSLPNVRPRRAYTLDASAKEREEASQNRRRKISVKRTKDERDSDLQFSFEYSFTSTGSSEDSDRLVLASNQMESSFLGQKTCQNVPTSPPLLLDFSNSFRDPSNLPTNPTIFYPPTSSQIDQQPTSMDSVQMMDTGDTSLKLDSIDSMDCGGDMSNCYIDMDTQTGFTHPHTLHTTLYPPSQLRSRSSEDSYSSSVRVGFVPTVNSLCPEQQFMSNNISKSL